MVIVQAELKNRQDTTAQAAARNLSKDIKDPREIIKTTIMETAADIVKAAITEIITTETVITEAVTIGLRAGIVHSRAVITEITISKTDVPAADLISKINVRKIKDQNSYLSARSS